MENTEDTPKAVTDVETHSEPILHGRVMTRSTSKAAESKSGQSTVKKRGSADDTKRRNVLGRPANSTGIIAGPSADANRLTDVQKMHKIEEIPVNCDEGVMKFTDDTKPAIVVSDVKVPHVETVVGLKLL